MQQIRIHDKLFEHLFIPDRIWNCSKKIAETISADYKNRASFYLLQYWMAKLFMFAAELLNGLPFPAWNLFYQTCILQRHNFLSGHVITSIGSWYRSKK